MLNYKYMVAQNISGRSNAISLNNINIILSDASVLHLIFIFFLAEY